MKCSMHLSNVVVKIQLLLYYFIYSNILVLPKFEVKVGMELPYQAIEHGDIHGAVTAR